MITMYCQVLDTCFNLQSRDNMSVVIVAFPNAPQVDPAAVEREQRLNNLLESRVTKICAEDANITLSQVGWDFTTKLLSNSPSSY